MKGRPCPRLQQKASHPEQGAVQAALSPRIARIHRHSVSTSALWLYPVETWFGQLARRAVPRGVFKSVRRFWQSIHDVIEMRTRTA